MTQPSKLRSGRCTGPVWVFVKPRRYCVSGGEYVMTLARTFVRVGGALAAPCPGCVGAPARVWREDGEKGSGPWRYTQHHQRTRKGI